jgi:hypothetical protein
MRIYAKTAGFLFGAALLLAIAAFCVFGFGVGVGVGASGEAGDWAFRSIYGVIGLGSLGGSVALAAVCFRKSSRH